MRFFESADAARKFYRETGEREDHHIIEIEDSNGEKKFILSWYSASYLKPVWEKNPIPEIRKVVSEVGDMWEEEIQRQKELESKIEGLSEIRSALTELERDHDEFNRMMDDEFNDGVVLPARPKVDIEQLCLKYPRAAVYLRFRAWERSFDHIKSSIGKRAAERILQGEDHAKVFEESEAEMGKVRRRRAWD